MSEIIEEATPTHESEEVVHEPENNPPITVELDVGVETESQHKVEAEVQPNIDEVAQPKSEDKTQSKSELDKQADDETKEDKENEVESPIEVLTSVGTTTQETQEVSSTRDDDRPKQVRSSRRPSYNSSRGYAGGYQNYGLTYLPYKSNFEPSEDARRRADEFFKSLKL